MQGHLLTQAVTILHGIFWQFVEHWNLFLELMIYKEI